MIAAVTAGLSAGQVLVLAAGAGAAVVVAGVGVAKGILLAAGLARVAAGRAWRRRRAPKGWLPAGLWLAWWRHRAAGVPWRGERPLSCLEEARFVAVMATWADREATRQAGVAEREQRERMEASEDA